MRFSFFVFLSSIWQRDYPPHHMTSHTVVYTKNEDTFCSALVRSSNTAGKINKPQVYCTFFRNGHFVQPLPTSYGSRPAVLLFYIIQQYTVVYTVELSTKKYPFFYLKNERHQTKYCTLYFRSTKITNFFLHM